MPALGMTQDTGRLVRWLRNPGDQVVKGEPIMEVETDKVTVEVEAPATGTLANVTAHEDDEIAVGQVIALILTEEEQLTSEASPPVAHPASPARVAATPKARRAARDAGIDLASLAGSGPHGAIVAADLATDNRSVAVNVPTSGVWRVMAERTAASWRSAPHFVLRRQARVTDLQSWRAAHNRQAEVRVTVTDLLVKVVATALRDQPAMRREWTDLGLREHVDVHIGIAVAIETGLVVPVIRDAVTLTVREIAERRAEVVRRAREGRLRPDDLSDGRITVSNLGMYGVDSFTAIINAPQPAIVAVGAIREVVMAHRGQVVIEPAV